MIPFPASTRILRIDILQLLLLQLALLLLAMAASAFTIPYLSLLLSNASSHESSLHYHSSSLLPPLQYNQHTHPKVNLEPLSTVWAGKKTPGAAVPFSELGHF